MMEVVSTVVDAAIQLLVQVFFIENSEKLQEWVRIVGLADDVEKLKSEMRNVQTVLAAAEGKEIKNKPLRESLENMKQLLYDAQDVMDELDYYRLQQQIEGDNTSASSSTLSSAIQLASNVTGRCSDLVVTFINRLSQKRKRVDWQPMHEPMLPLGIRRDVSRRIKQIVNQLEKFGEDVCQVLNSVEKLDNIARGNQSESATLNTRLTTFFHVEPKVYGRDAERDKIIELLISDKSDDLNVLPIIGNGGVGKTTLTRYVYHDQRVKNHFDLQIWICVSNNFDKVRLTHEMVEYVSKDSHKGTKSFGMLQKILVDKIKNKRFLLVLDDMWEDKDKSQWDELVAPLKCVQVKGCMILTTTRSSYVAKMVGTVGPISLGGLDDKEFWLFFKACAFGDENDEKHPILQHIGKQIAKKLKGYPLAAQSVGALLRRDVSYEHWRRIQDNWKYLQGGNDIIPILKLSYDYLPFYLQQCFSYCSLFPEDHQFDKEELVRIWISQDFVYCEHASQRLEDKGSEYLDDLVNLGFFQQVEGYNGVYYVMHDLMHDLAGMVSSNECATIDGSGSKKILPSICHLSIRTDSAYHTDEHSNMRPNEKFEKELQKIRSLKKLRTLMFFGQYNTNLLRSCQTMCEDMCSLRFLQICATVADFDFLCDHVKPFHLRYLKVLFKYGQDIALPQALRKFYHLQVLDVGYRSNPVIPSGVNNLVNLRHFVAKKELHSSIVSVGKMTSLQELQEFRVQKANGFDIGQLRHMGELVLLRICQLENVQTKLEAFEARLREKEHLEKLCLSWDDSGESSEPTAAVAAEVLEGLEPHPNIKHLRINGYNGATAPTWLAANLSLTLLQSLHLENCRKWKILHLEMLPFLRKLKLIQMWNANEVSVPSLEELVLREMPKLERCVGTYTSESTSHLKKLIIESCRELKDFTLFQRYDFFEVEQKRWFPCLNELTIKNCPQLRGWRIQLERCELPES